MRISFLGFVYLVIGIIVAAVNDYFDNMNTFKQVVEALIAVLIWPLILLGVEININ
jgi:ABC-type Na+ efflux pump permease subunit